jgi:hypothetical protein
MINQGYIVRFNLSKNDKSFTDKVYKTTKINCRIICLIIQRFNCQKKMRKKAKINFKIKIENFKKNLKKFFGKIKKNGNRCRRR